MSYLDLDSEALKGFENIGIAFSGGLDSSVILQLLSESSIPNKDITALHINHGLSKDSDKWESFCAERAAKLDISFKSWKLESLDKISEDSLRIKRFEAFGKWSRENDLIITGHHLDDQIETVLFRIFRGTGIKGLSGIKEFSRVNNINFYRPLLKSTKEELLNYALVNNLLWVEDKSNKESKFSRNIIRNELMPTISKRWPHIYKSIERLSFKAEKVKKILQEIAVEDFQKIKASNQIINIPKLMSLSQERQENLMLYWLNHINKIEVSSGQLNQIFSSILQPSQGSSKFYLNSNIENSECKLVISSKEINIFNQNLLKPLPDNLNLCWNLKDTIEIPSGELSISESIGKGIDKKYLGSSALIKARVGGERCKPFGRNKSQKIKNLFQEFDIPDWKREYIPLIYINDKIAAVGDLWVCDEFHTNLNEKGISIIWNKNFS